MVGRCLRGAPLDATIAAMEFKVLGPVEVSGPRGRIKIGSGLQRAILALLVLRVGETVSTDHLIDEVWGDDPPPSAHHAIGVHVSRLRRARVRITVQTNAKHGQSRLI